jgi:hypothetical protein
MRPEEPQDPERAREDEPAADPVEGAARTVDGDFNGAPELAGVEASLEREAVDVVEAIEGEAAREREDRPRAAVLAEQLRERRQILRERMPEARAAGLGDVFEAAAEASAPDAGDAPLLADEQDLRERLAQVDEALQQLESSAVPTGRVAGSDAR